jgi:ribonucleoside-diphosphate reductase alpha chain
MRGGHAAVARAYILYRKEHRRARTERADIGTPETGIPDGTRVFTVIGADGRPAPLDADRLRAVVTEACTGLAGVDPAAVLAATRDNLYDRMSAS